MQVAKKVGMVFGLQHIPHVAEIPGQPVPGTYQQRIIYLHCIFIIILAHITGFNINPIYELVIVCFQCIELGRNETGRKLPISIFFVLRSFIKSK